MTLVLLMMVSDWNSPVADLPFYLFFIPIQTVSVDSAQHAYFLSVSQCASNYYVPHTLPHSRSLVALYRDLQRHYFQSMCRSTPGRLHQVIDA